MTRGDDPRYFPPTAEEIDARMAEHNRIVLEMIAEMDKEIAERRNLDRIPRKLTDDEFDDNQFSQENGDGFVY